MYIKICLSVGQIGEAEKALHELDRYDTGKKFVHHRRATILAKKGSLDSALREAEIAFDSGRGTFEAHCQKIDILIELGRYTEIEAELESLKRRFGNIRRDIQTGLRCKLYIRQGDWRRAQAVWDSLDDKNSEINNVMMRQILVRKSEDPSLSITERQSVRDEIALLDPDLRDLSGL